jgi:hypothetical protein
VPTGHDRNRRNLVRTEKKISWLSLTCESQEGLEPLRALIVQHLEEMLQELRHHNDEMQTDNAHSEEDNSENT